MGDFWVRLSLIIDNENISINKFEDNINASRGVIAKSIRNKTDISTKWITAIKDKFPHYSLDWLLMGTGDMLSTPINYSEYIINYLREKDKKIEELLQENLRLKIVLGQDSSISTNIDGKQVIEALTRLEEKVDKKGGFADSAGAVVG